MPIFDIFYQMETGSQIVFGEDPTGTVAIDRLIQGQKKYWVSPVLQRERKPKKLILSDWTARNWSDEKIAAVQKALGELIDKGFILYIEQLGQIKLLLKDELSCLDNKLTREAMKPNYPSDVYIAAMEQQHLTRDELQILDDYWLHALLSNKDTPQDRYLSTSDFSGLAQIEQRNKLIDITKHSEQPLKYILHDIWGGEYSNRIAQLNLAFPNVKKTVKYHTATLNDSNLRCLLNQQDCNDGNSTLTLSDLENIKKMDLFSIQSTENMELIFKELSFKKLSLNKLEEIRLYRLINLQQLLNAAPKLKSINLAFCKQLEAHVELKLPFHNDLEKINLIQTDISPSNLQQFLHAAPKLKSIHLGFCNLQQINFKFESSSFNELEEISLADANISSINLLQLLNVAPKLKNISLDSCNLLRTNFEFPSLNELESISLAYTNISQINLKKLLNAALKLKNISLVGCDLLQTNFEFPSLKELEEINLSNTNICPINLQKLLKVAPKLKSINLSRCKQLEASFEFELSPLKELEMIRLAYTNISSINLQKILKVSPKLKKISLDGCNLLQTNFAFSFFNEFEVIYLENADISPINLQKLLNVALKLKRINLGRCKQLDANFEFELPLLKALEEIDVSDSNICLANLEQLMRVARNLKIIHMDGCFTRDQELALEEKYPLLIFKNGYKSTLETTPNHVNRPIDLNHNVKQFKEHTPTPKEEIFEFHGQNKTKNQDMITEKFCQYLTLTQQNLHLIPEIRDGVCDALAHLYCDYSLKKWEGFITASSNWDGKNTTLANPLTSHFNTLQTYINKYQINQAKNSPQQYLGNNLNGFLNQLTGGCILANPWHAIAVKTIKFGKRWMVYDPNYVDGAREVSQDQILITIKKAIGSILSVESDSQVTPVIKDQASFIEEGGLLALTRCTNASEMLDAMQKCHYSPQALDGLLLRAMDAEPAWSKGIRHSNPRVAAFTHQLLQQFYEKNPHFKQALQKSIESMAPQKKQESITQLIQQADKSFETNELSESLIEIIRTPIATDYQRALQTWQKQTTQISTFLEYAQQCMRPNEVKKRLIELDSVAQVDATRFGLQQYCMQTQRPVFYVHSPEDLVCKAPFVQRKEDGKGYLRKGPGGPLYDFLQASHQGQTPVLLVNYSEFHADDLVRLNALLNKECLVDDTKVPENTLIIGLMNSKKPDCYQGADFYSRFDKVEKLPLTAAVLEQKQVTLPIIEANEHAHDKQVINLFHSPNWEAQLLGHWALDGESLSFQEGLLVEALKHGSTLEIQNGLWSNEAFARFWQQACLQGFITHTGRTITIPPGLQLIQSEGYDWDALKSFFCIVDTKPEGEQVLNPYCFSDFLNRYLCDNQQLHRQAGFVVSAKENTLPVYLTRTLGEDEWAMLLSECQRHQVQLQVRCAPGITLLKALAPDYSPMVNIGDIKQHTQIITSTDVDTTVAQLTQGQNNWQVIDVSECNPSQLLNSFQGGFNQESLGFEFKSTTGALIQGLEQKQNILLKGYFSDQLVDSLAPLLLKRHDTVKEPVGQLIVVSDNPSSFQYLPTNHHQVTENEKLDCLGLMDNISKETISPFLAKEPLSTLQARHDFWQHNPTSDSSDGAWDGMVHLKKAIPPLVKLNPQTSAAEAQVFTASRLQAVHAQLQHAPYVFLSGLSGVGKSTFVTKELSKHASFYEGKEAIEEWAQDRGDKQTILFLDEANLSAGNWSQFEGLFSNPPGILLDKIFYPLTENHKVVFAGNPISYGDERKMSTLFQRHGKALVFEPLPTAVLYEDILKPVFANTPLESQAAELSVYFLEVYAFLVDCSTTEVLISPRELQMMALMTVSFSPSIQPEVTAQHCAWMFAKNSVPQTRRAEFDKRFNEILQYVAPKQDANDAFLLTPSRYPIRHQLDALLKLREKRSQGTNDAQKYGGLGGIILEGEPGIGKSELVIKTLVLNGYQEAHEKSVVSEYLFYRLPVSWSVAEKEALLRRAFDEGAVVVIDEINSSPMIENVLNYLLMGKTPEGNRPTKPGFMIIGTQNPTTMAGRRAPSTALSRRLITEVLPTYTEQEMHDILMEKGVEGAKAKAMVMAFNHNVEHAQKNHLSPVPCFRDLLQLADKERIIKPKHQGGLLERLKKAMNTATDHYLKHHGNRTDSNHQCIPEATFFSWTLHGKAGRLNAKTFNAEIQSKDTLNDVIEAIDTLLTDENTRYESHSLAFYILDSIGTTLSHDCRLIGHGNYSQDVWAWIKNLVFEQIGLQEGIKPQM